MSFYADYIVERTTDEIIETDKGFATYRYINNGESVYIIDIFTEKSSRKSGAAKDLADAIAYEAKTKGAKEMLGSVMPSAKGSTDSIRVLLAYGFELQSAMTNAIIFRKDL